MNEDENILEKAIEAIRNESIPPGPAQELVDATVTKLTEAQERSGTESCSSGIGLINRLRVVGGIARFAAAAVLLIVAGYVVGRISAPKPPNIEQLQDALEPVIRRNVIAQLSSDLKLALTGLRDDLDRQRRQDMARFAAQTLAASGAATNELLTELIESIDKAQTQDRQWFTAALRQIELNRLQDNARLSDAFATFAVRTEDELELTKQGVVQLLSYALPESSAPIESENIDNMNERNEK